MIVAVTGTAGFIGSHLTEKLLSQGATVIGVDSFTDYYHRSRKESNMAAFRNNPNFRFYEADLNDLELTEVFKDAGYIFHQAAQAGVRASWGSTFHTYVRNNLESTQRLMEAAKNLPRLRKIVYASTSSVYGDAETYPTTEDLVPRPVSPYGVTKLAGEQLCYLYNKSFGVPTIALRYFTVYGPRQRPDMAFTKFMTAARDSLPITLYSDGLQTRDFTFVGDIVEANLKAAFSSVVGESFNIGGGSSVSVREVVASIERITGVSFIVNWESQQQGDARHTSADTTKARQILGFAPAVSLDEGLRRQWDWVQSLC